MKNMTFHAYHGDFKFERQFGQVYNVDVEISFDAKPAGNSDHIEDTINIYQVYSYVEKIMLRGKRFNLIEALAETIAARLLEKFDRIAEVVIRMRKHNAPVKGQMDYAEVEIRRCGHDVS